MDPIPEASMEKVTREAVNSGVSLSWPAKITGKPIATNMIKTCWKADKRRCPGGGTSLTAYSYLLFFIKPHSSRWLGQVGYSPDI